MGKIVPNVQMILIKFHFPYFYSHLINSRVSTPTFVNNKILNSSAYSTEYGKSKWGVLLLEGSPMVTCLNFKKNAPVRN